MAMKARTWNWFGLGILEIVFGAACLLALRPLTDFPSEHLIDSTPTLDPAEIARRGSQRGTLVQYVIAFCTLAVFVGAWTVVVCGRRLSKVMASH